jgi:hypothetical protein
METSSGIPHRIGSDEENSGLPFLLNRARDEQLSLLAFSPSQAERDLVLVFALVASLMHDGVWD